jgi:RNA polymerase sigma-70 factor, ECF subfamily
MATTLAVRVAGPSAASGAHTRDRQETLTGVPTAEDPPVRAPDRTADALAQGVARGDAGAFERLYDLLGRAVYGVCLRVLRDPDHAAEVAQEVWLEVWRAAPRFDESLGTARTWTLTIAHRRAVDRVRSVQAQRDRDQRDLDLQPARLFDEVAESVETSFEHERVRRCLETLTDTQRGAVELAFYGGRTYREVADELDAALPAVKTRIRDGLLRLRTCLGVSA